MTLIEMIRNKDNLYEGDLVHYFRLVFHQRGSSKNSYHNFRHPLHVFAECYDACLYYWPKGGAGVGRIIRNILIASITHDIDHSGQADHDDLNIIRALRALEHHVLPVDRPYLPEIGNLIRDATQHPYRIPGEKLPLPAQILRDADLSQGLSEVWIQQVVFGLAAEQGVSPLKILESQWHFYDSFTFSTKWAREKFPPSVIEAKKVEAAELLKLVT